MKKAFALLLIAAAGSVQAQAWKTLPQGVRIIGYRNVITSKVDSNFDRMRSESPLGAQFRVDMSTINNLTSGEAQNVLGPSFNNLVVGEYKVDAQAQFNVQGTGFGYGITDRVMFYAEISYWNATVDAKIKRTQKNNYRETANGLQNNGGLTEGTAAESLNNLPDVNESFIQSVVTDYYGYKPIGRWQGAGYGDMETGVMARVVDKGVWGLLFYPGVVLPTGRVDDPDLLQDVGFGDGQVDIFSELASGYILNDRLSFGTTLRYTHQTAADMKLRIPDSQDFTLSPTKGTFNVKYGDRVNLMLNSTIRMNDWVSFTPVYRYMYQMASTYKSEYTEANKYLGYNTDKQEHQVQLTTSFSSITPFLKKQFVLPAQVNVNVVQTVGGKNVPKVGRLELELRMLF
jgi:hypothetical protein